MTSHLNYWFLICYRSCKAFPHWPSLVWERRQWYAGSLSSDWPRSDQLLPRGMWGETSPQGLDVCRWSQGWHHNQKREARVSSALLALLCGQEGQVSAVEEILSESEGRYRPFLTFFWESEHSLIWRQFIFALVHLRQLAGSSIPQLQNVGCSWILYFTVPTPWDQSTSASSWKCLP